MTHQEFIAAVANLRLHLNKLHFFKTMPALSFSVFKDKILDGAKRQTIRSIRKNPIKKGDKLFLYWKQQSPKDCEKLGEATCIRVTPIQIYKNGFVTPYISGHGFVMPYISKQLPELNNFAIADGFDGWNDLLNFFQHTHSLPFTGVLIQWDSIIKDPCLIKLPEASDHCPCEYDSPARLAALAKEAELRSLESQK